jgi:gamma-polyglutamate biosynthesis protein CapA
MLKEMRRYKKHNKLEKLEKFKKLCIIPVPLLLILGFVIIVGNVGRCVTVSLTGDILLDRGVKTYIDGEGIYYPYEKINCVFDSSDIVFGNLECPLTLEGIPVLKRRDLIFHAHPSNAAALKAGGFDVLNLANNHAMDYGTQGLVSTLEALKDAGIRTVGAGDDASAARQPVYVKFKNITIGFLGFSTFPTEGYFHFPHKPDVACVDSGTISDEISSAREKCDVLIVSFHWGKEFDFYPSIQQRELAHLAVDSGADVVAGHHPHVLQGIEEYNGGYIFYSLGNFIFDSQAPLGTDETVIINLEIDKKGIRQMKPVPVRIQNCQPHVATGEDGEYILDRLKLYSDGIFPYSVFR